MFLFPGIDLSPSTALRIGTPCQERQKALQESSALHIACTTTKIDLSMPGGPLAGFLWLPITCLFGLYIAESKPWRFVFATVLVIWLGFAIVLPVTKSDWGRLFFPGMIIAFWFFLSEIKRMFGKD
jgi:hypothetical protein